MASNEQRKGSRKDPSWKYGVEIEVPVEGRKKGYKYLKCNFCGKVIKGGVKRMKEHLACTHKDAAPCANVPIEVKNEIKQYLKNFASMKIAFQRNFKERVDRVACSVSSNDSYGNPLEGMNSSHSGSSRGIREPMEDKRDDENERMMEGEKMTPMSAKDNRNQVCLDIGRFLFENGIPLSCAASPSFITMLDSIGNYGEELKSPTMDEMETWILKEEVKTTSKTVDEIKATWKHTGVSLLSDGWLDIKDKSMINFLVNNQYGTVFLKSVDASDCIKNAKKLFKLLDSVVEEIGEEIVIQVVTDNTSAYKLAGNMLMEKRKSLYWTPCVVRCIDVMLEKIGELPQQKNVLIKAKRISNFIYNHRFVLNLFRKIAKKDLLQPSATRFATAFLTLESMYELKQPLQMMFVSNEWSNCALAKKPYGKAIRMIVMDETVFWPSVDYSIKTTKPLVDVLRIVLDEKTPPMAFIYGAMNECKENIAKNFDGDLSSYKEILDVVDQNWEFQLYRDLHVTAYYLNPRFRWSPNVSKLPEIKYGLYGCMERLFKDEDTYLKVDLQFDEFNYQRGLFGCRSSLTSYLTRSPVTWWDNFGDEVPELKRFATKILGLTCSSLVCERKWNRFNQVHTKRRNRLRINKMNSMMYIMYNKKLNHKFLKKKSLKEEEDDPLIFENVSSDDEWMANPNDDDDDDDDDDKRAIRVSDDDKRAIRVSGALEDEGESLASKKRKSIQGNSVDKVEIKEEENDDLWII